ncbi:MAG: DNA ligase [Epsilonproteobacteria bacterium]|nr:DNA ligase [Campylobacterota bacterium]
MCISRFLIYEITPNRRRTMLKTNELVSMLTKYNNAYRSGNPIVSDEYYDLLVEELRASDPSNPYLHKVEEESDIKRRKIEHPEPMLSMEKAYSVEEIRSFVGRIENVIRKTFDQEMSEVYFKITPKLDGLAGRDDGETLSTRGNGDFGFDITDAFEKGVVAFGGRGKGTGEIVMNQKYFDENLYDQFSHPRNVVVGAVMSDVVNPVTQDALNENAIVFVPYSELKEYVRVDAKTLLKQFTSIASQIREHCVYPTDGVVIEAIHKDPAWNAMLHKELGSTSHHNRWQIAFKTKGEIAETTVEEIIWQVGRTGKITPVLRVFPVNVSGATVSRVTAHNAGLLKEMRCGINSRIALIRSGEVIPKIEYVVSESDNGINGPTVCPECGEATRDDGLFVICDNQQCPAKIHAKLNHFFKVIGIDLFGPKTIEKLISAGQDTIIKILFMDKEDFIQVGFTEKQAENLKRELIKITREPIQDFVLLASFGIEGLGHGDSKRLLQFHKIKDIFDITYEQIVAIHGFSHKTATKILNNLPDYKATYQTLNDGFFVRIKPTKKENHTTVVGKLFEKKVVFTGMLSRPRREFQALVEKHGGVSQSIVGKTTDYLVVGENIGNAKITKAVNLGVKVINEQEFLELIA